jgi:hypothetical protein
MLRFKFLIAAVPLIAATAAIVARLEASPGVAPCLAVEANTVEAGSEPWVTDLHVDFTDDPKLATVRVGVADSADGADLVLVDDGTEAEDKTCSMSAAQSVAMNAGPARHAPLIYLAQDGPADYLVFVQSSRFSTRDAAALIVSAHARDLRMADAAP